MQYNLMFEQYNKYNKPVTHEFLNLNLFFQISAVVDRPGKYAIQDLGSAGGTFIRIQTGQKKRLHAGKENNFFIRKNEIDVENIFSSFLPL